VFEDTKGVIRSRQLKKNKQYKSQRKKTKRQAIYYETLHRKLKIEQFEPYDKTWN
jgi:hypothetical protein